MVNVRRVPSGMKVPLVQESHCWTVLKSKLKLRSNGPDRRSGQIFNQESLEKYFTIYPSISLLYEIESVVGRRSNFGKRRGIRGDGVFCSSLSIAIFQNSIARVSISSFFYRRMGKEYSARVKHDNSNQLKISEQNFAI